MPESAVQIDIEGVDDVYRGGERAFVRVVVTAEESTTVSSLRVAPVLRFETPGDEPHRDASYTEARREPVERTDIELEAGEQRTFELDFLVPEGPYRVGAEHFDVDWAIAARAEIEPPGQSLVRAAESFRLESGPDQPYDPAKHIEQPDDQKHLLGGCSGFVRTLAATLVFLASLALVALPVWLEWSLGPESPHRRIFSSPDWAGVILLTTELMGLVTAVFCGRVALKIIFQRRFGVWTLRESAYEVAGIDVGDPVVRAGETVEASAWLTASDAMTVDGCVLTLVCRESFRARNAAGRDPRTVSETVYERHLPNADTRSRTIAAGENLSYEFEHRVPSEARSSVASRDTDHGWAVEWELRATFDWAGTPNPEVTRPIVVRPAEESES